MSITSECSSRQAIYEAVGRMGFETGNILEPSMGVGNFFGMLPEEMRNSRLCGVELDPISGRIAKQLYPKADITVHHLRNQPCQCLQDFGGQPEPAGCPYL